MANQKDTGLIKTLNTAYLDFPTVGQPGDDIERYNLSSIQQHFQTQFINSFDSSLKGNAKGFAILNNPIIGIFQHLRIVADYFAGEFIPSCESDKKFLRQVRNIGRVLIDKGYFGEVYVTYSEEVKESERKAVEAAGEVWFDPKNHWHNNFRLFTKVNLKTSEFKSVFNPNVQIKLDLSKLVRFSFRGHGNFLHGGQVLWEYMAGLNDAVSCAKMSIKTVIIDQGDPEEYDSLEEQFLNSNTYVVRKKPKSEKDREETIFDNFVFSPVQDVNAVLQNVQALFDKRAGFLGWFGKDIDNKKERVTVQEGAMTTKEVNNIIESMLLDLRDTFDLLKEVCEGIPDDFDIEIERIKPQLNNQPIMGKPTDAEVALEN